MKPVQGAGSDAKSRTVILKRNKLIFEDKECEVINFIDISAYIGLKKEQENN